MGSEDVRCGHVSHHVGHRCSPGRCVGCRVAREPFEDLMDDAAKGCAGRQIGDHERSEITRHVGGLDRGLFTSIWIVYPWSLLVVAAAHGGVRVARDASGLGCDSAE